MKIAFLTQEDRIYVPPFFDEFFRQELADIEVVAVLSSKIMGDRGRVQLMRELFCLYGAFGLLRLLLRTALSWMMQWMPARTDAKKFYSVRQICRAYHVPHLRIENPNSEEVLGKIASFSPDLIVSVAFPYILKENLLSLPPLGCVNVHHAPLPRYRGMMPTFWQMYHREKQVGVTIHTMIARVDAGNALLQERLAIVDGESLDSLIRRTKRHAAQCMLRVLRQIAQQTQTSWPLESEPGSYFTFPTLAEIKEFRRCGFRAI